MKRLILLCLAGLAVTSVNHWARAEQRVFFGGKMSGSVMLSNAGDPNGAEMGTALGGAFFVGGNVTPMPARVALRLDVGYSRSDIRIIPTTPGSTVVPCLGGCTTTPQAEPTRGMHTVDLVPSIEMTIQPGAAPLFFFADAGAGVQLAWIESKSWGYPALSGLSSVVVRSAFGFGFRSRGGLEVAVAPIGFGIYLPSSLEMKSRLGSRFITWQPAFLIRFQG